MFDRRAPKATRTATIVPFSWTKLSGRSLEGTLYLQAQNRGWIVTQEGPKIPLVLREEFDFVCSMDRVAFDCRAFRPLTPIGQSADPPPTSADQVLCREMATSMSDVYSFGVVLWECLTRKVPWADVADVGVLSMAVVSGERPPVPENAPEDLAELARRCWSGDPTARPTLESVLSNYL